MKERNMRKLFAVLAALAIGVGAASAHTVQTWIDIPSAGNFKVWGSTSDGDNLGLGSFDIALTGGVNANQPVNTSPAGYWGGIGIGPAAGFVMFRSGVGTVPFSPLSSAQDTTGAVGAAVIYGVGNSIVNFGSGVFWSFKIPASGIAGQTRTQNVRSGFSYMVELGSGTYTGTEPAIYGKDTSFTILVTVGGAPAFPDHTDVLPRWPLLNEPPVAEANGPYYIDGSYVSIPLNSTGSNDPDGTITSYEWFVNNVPVGTGANYELNYVEDMFNNGFISEGDYTLKLVVTDNGSATDDDTAIIHIPEPATLVLLAMGALALLRRRW